MKTKTIYLLAIVFLIASCAGKQQDKTTTEAEQVKTTENEVQTESSEDLNSEDTETITTEVELQNSTELSIEDKKKFLGTWKAEGDNPYTVLLSNLVQTIKVKFQQNTMTAVLLK